MKRFVILGLVIVLSACGAARDLKPAEGKALPVAPYGATATPTPNQLLTASIQARPARSDDLLTSSQERQGNEFDLPPAN
ncbi:hypothetical protein [Sphingomonas sp.]|uniref:hypothetical protein n=1 Tax=Sphingomonas sp. TaxID=28214 RepID=UPI0025F61E56|nr:hypothetical protein [Sphingomonas sp.]